MTDVEFVTEVNQNLARLRHLCVVYSQSASEREDLLQDILVAAWRARATYRGEASFSTWLYRVAVSVALQRLRRLRSRPAFAAIDTDRLPAAPSAPLADQLDLMTLIDKLDAIDRAVLCLYLEDRSYTEIAQVIGTSANAVGARLTRIRERLRSLSSGGSRGD